MYRPSFKNLFESQQDFLPNIENSTLSEVYEYQLAHIEAIYSATAEELEAAQSLDAKMEELEQVLSETRKLVEILKDEVSTPQDQQSILDLVQLNKVEINELEDEVDQKQEILEAATRRSRQLSKTGISVHFESDSMLIH